MPAAGQVIDSADRPQGDEPHPSMSIAQWLPVRFAGEAQ
jgi:hypothetical protein